MFRPGPSREPTGFTTWRSGSCFKWPIKGAHQVSSKRHIRATTRSWPLRPSFAAASQGSSSALCFVSSRKTVAEVADVISHVDALDFPVSPSATVLKPSLLQPCVVVYEGVGHLFHRGVKWAIGADNHRKIKFCCVQSKAVEPYLEGCGLDREDVLRRFLFVEGAVAYHVGSSVALKVMSYLPLPYSALSALLVVPRPLRDAVYDHMAKKRYGWFGKEDKCLVTREHNMLDRFIDRDEILERSRRVL